MLRVYCPLKNFLQDYYWSLVEILILRVFSSVFKNLLCIIEISERIFKFLEIVIGLEL
jgi:hypothetical protein